MRHITNIQCYVNLIFIEKFLKKFKEIIYLNKNYLMIKRII